MKEHTLLIAIGTDELPPKILKKLGQDLCKHTINSFMQNNICYNTTTWFAAPRHLAVKIKLLISENNWSSLSNSNILDYSNNNTITSHHKNHKSNENILHYDNKSTKTYKKNLNQNKYINKNLLIKIVNQILEKLTNYEMMRWNSILTPFIRPVNTITILLDSHLIEGYFFQKQVDRILHGHKYIINNQITLNHADDYPNILITQGKIVVDYNKRKNILQAEIIKQATKLGGVIDIKNEKFLEEINSSIEWPIALSGKFDQKFLELPPEILVHIMQKKQKYFPIYHTIENTLLPYFIVVINTITDNYKKIISGHENIIKTHFEDAEFFLKKDNQHCLEEYIPKLHSILFHRKLGSMYDKINRIAELSGWIASQINEDISQAKRAGYLCKCDLASNIVQEFPELQGIIGMYYARRDGESEQVALAQKEHYHPKYTTDTLPIQKISSIVSIADKIDTISGIFGVEKLPTNNRDPFALKRAAIGILNVIMQKKLSLNLIDLIHKSITLYESNLTNTIPVKSHIYNFIHKRLYYYYLLKGYKIDIIKSVLNKKLTNILIYDIQIISIDNFRKFNKKEYDQLHSVYKRITNILKTQNISFTNKTIQNSLFIDPSEMKLFSQINKIKRKIILLLKQNHYNDTLLEIVNLSNSVNNFLDKIKIIDNNQHIKINRLTLLNTIRKLMLKTIDLSTLEH